MNVIITIKSQVTLSNYVLLFINKSNVLTLRKKYASFKKISQIESEPPLLSDRRGAARSELNITTFTRLYSSSCFKRNLRRGRLQWWRGI